jgi:hypothetical protein
MNNKDKMIVVGAVVLMIVLLIATVAVIGATNNNANNSTNNVITLNGFRLDINYDGTSSGYFGPTIQNQTMNLDVRPGEEFTERATLTNNATSLSHSVIGIKVSSPFALDSITPSISSPISPEGSMTYTLVITAPSTGGDHVLSIVVTTT